MGSGSGVYYCAWWSSGRRDGEYLGRSHVVTFAEFIVNLYPRKTRFLGLPQSLQQQPELQVQARQVRTLLYWSLAYYNYSRSDLHSIYHYTSGYWLCNDKEHREARSVTFNVPAFCQLASEAVGANAVTDMVKINESLNRVFLLRFDTGREAIPRFPTSLAGPPHFATRERSCHHRFPARRLAFPIPRVLARSSRVDSTDVGAEFMLMEKASGISPWGCFGRYL
ncbi:hypothetical protein BU15DRAFT_59794 [Melanogaster broomeanus]|nr:hypothetical protein BU15DRAFT_59794 [Melanogaster broomeanus]